MTKNRIVIADDHPLFRGALRQALMDRFTGLEIEEAGSLDEIIQVIENSVDTDLILLDLDIPGVKGFSGLMYLRAQYPDIPIAIVSATEDPPVIRRCLNFGASGFIPKSVGAETIRTAIEGVLAGEIWTPPDLDLMAEDGSEMSVLVAKMATLTPQQVRVLMMLREGLLNKQIAYELSVSEATVKAHVSAILQKLNVESRTQAVIAASEIETGRWELTGEG
ncbi:MAG: response regulator transcription factor [Fimbriimonadaceae bacterium]|nr:response regulator transcription factor [Alphaproteobacteria bacterium]